MIWSEVVEQSFNTVDISRLMPNSSRLEQKEGGL